MPGPLQVIAVSFGPGAGADFEGRLLAEVDRLQGRGVLRLLDVLFVAKDEEGKLQRLVVGDDDDFGALLASVVPLDGAGLVEPSVGEGLCGFDPGDAWALAQSLRPGSALAFLLIEHAWAQPLFAAIADTGGALVGEGFLTSETGLLVGAAVAAMEQTAGLIAAAEAGEANATLLALAAEARATETMAASEAIRAAAAAHAVRSLISVGVVAQAAAHDAVEAALAAASLIVAAADEAAAEAIAQDAAEVTAAHDAAAEAVAEAAATIKAASISPAEARVLRYLPTQSSFAVIADKMGISRSAAKERAERAYKKLGVHSRADAVSRARALGIID